MRFPKSSLIVLCFPLTRQEGHTHSDAPVVHSNYTCKAAHPAAPTLVSDAALPPLTPMPFWADPSQTVVRMWLSHGQRAKANKPAMWWLTRPWTGMERGKERGGLTGGAGTDRGREMVTQRKQAQQERASLLTQRPRHVLSCNSHLINPN